VHNDLVVITKAHENLVLRQSVQLSHVLLTICIVITFVFSNINYKYINCIYASVIEYTYKLYTYKSIVIDITTETVHRMFDARQVYILFILSTVDRI